MQVSGQIEFTITGQKDDSVVAEMPIHQNDGVFKARSEYVKRGRSVSVVRTLVTGENGRPIAEVTTSHIASR